MQSIKLTPQEIEAIRNGNKTMFREPIEGITIQHDLGIAGQELGERDIYNPETGEISYAFSIGYEDEEEYQESVVRIPSKYQVGETVFVQEEFIYSEIASVIAYKIEAEKHLRTDLTHEEVLEWQSISWEPASEMQEHQARLFLTITSIKAEALQNISEEDCIREGVDKRKNNHETSPHEFLYFFNSRPHTEAKTVFKKFIWKEKNHKAPYDWESNPYVFANGFEVV